MASIGGEEGTTRRGATGTQDPSEHRRVAQFSTSGPISASVASRSGDVIVHVGERHEVQVVLRVRSRSRDHLLDFAEVTYDETSRQLRVNTRASVQFDSFNGLKDLVKKNWFDFSSSDLDVEVLLPAGSSLDVSTVSGDVGLRGTLGATSVASVSGDVVVEGDAQSLDVRTTSGDLRVGRVVESFKARTASGDVRCDHGSRMSDVASASGDVDIAVDQPGELVVKSVSGDVVVRVARGLVLDINGNTVSGDLGSNIALDASSDGASDDEVIFIKVTTVSGDVRVNRAP